MDPDRSELDLDRPATLAQKVGATALLLLLGGYFFLLTCAALAAKVPPWLALPAHIAIEICWTFWIFGLLFVWWRPPWLRRVYLSAEKRMMRLARMLVWIAFVLFVISVVLIYALGHFGVLPLPPR